MYIVDLQCIWISSHLPALHDFVLLIYMYFMVCGGWFSPRPSLYQGSASHEGEILGLCHLHNTANAGMSCV